MATTYPDVNGLKPDWSSVEINVPGLGIFTGVTEITYSDNLEPGSVKGTAANDIGTTRGEYSAEGSITMNLQDHRDLVTKIGPGFMETFFTIVVSYDEGDGDIIVDTIVGVRLMSNEGGGSQGSDPSQRSSDLYVNRIKWNGVDPIQNIAQLGATS